MRFVLSLALLTAAAAPAYARCGPPLDPQMVRFMPRTPSSGPNPLFRLVGARVDAGPDDAHCDLIRRAIDRRR
jgi:hypothetical protein